MTTSSQNNDIKSFEIDSLFCHEVLDDVKMDFSEEESICAHSCTSPPLVLAEQDLISEDEEVLYLLTKEKEFSLASQDHKHIDPSSFCVARREAIDWMLKIKARYNFSSLTCVLCINYFDRYLISTFEHGKDEDVHLALATCLSLAVKVNEVTVLRLRDLEVLNSKYVLEAKTIQQRELSILHKLKWRMHPVTPLSFLDQIIKRLGLKTHLQPDFYKKCEDLILSVVADWKSLRYLPSLLATSTILHVLHQVEPFNEVKYQDKLLSIFRTSEEQIEECCELIGNILNICHTDLNHGKRKRQYRGADGRDGDVEVNCGGADGRDVNVVAHGCKYQRVDTGH